MYCRRSEQQVGSTFPTRFRLKWFNKCSGGFAPPGHASAERWSVVRRGFNAHWKDDSSIDYRACLRRNFQCDEAPGSPEVLVDSHCQAIWANWSSTDQGARSRFQNCRTGEEALSLYKVWDGMHILCAHEAVDITLLVEVWLRLHQRWLFASESAKIFQVALFGSLGLSLMQTAYGHIVFKFDTAYVDGSHRLRGSGHYILLCVPTLSAVTCKKWLQQEIWVLRKLVAMLLNEGGWSFRLVQADPDRS